MRAERPLDAQQQFGTRQAVETPVPIQRAVQARPVDCSAAGPKLMRKIARDPDERLVDRVSHCRLGRPSPGGRNRRPGRARMVASPIRWLPVASVTIAATVGPMKDVALPERASSPKYSACRSAGARRAISARTRGLYRADENPQEATREPDPGPAFARSPPPRRR